MPRAAPVTRATLPFNRLMSDSARATGRPPRSLLRTLIASSAERPDRVLAVPVDARAPVAREHVVRAGIRGNQLDETRRARAVAHEVDGAAARHGRREHDVVAASLVFVSRRLDVFERDAEVVE